MVGRANWILSLWKGLFEWNVWWWLMAMFVDSRYGVERIVFLEVGTYIGIVVDDLL